MPTAIAPPHWDLTPFFPGIDSPEFLLAFSKFQEKIAGAERMWDAEGITSSKGTVEENQVIQTPTPPHEPARTMRSMRELASSTLALLCGLAE
ncbi:MAG: hypothetical protein J0H02_05355 [Armatimonadetes bacterium]|nr:hypothetical protein [Armatimonadota bacterium]